MLVSFLESCDKQYSRIPPSQSQLHIIYICVCVYHGLHKLHKLQILHIDCWI